MTSSSSCEVFGDATSEPTSRRRNASRNHRPAELSRAMVSELVKEFYGLRVRSCQELDSYDDRNYFVSIEDGAPWDNEHLRDLWAHGYVLKVLNSLDSRRADVIEAKNRLIVQAAKGGIPTPRPVPSINGNLSRLCRLSKESAGDCQSSATDGNKETDMYLIRLMEYLPGKTLASVPLTAQLALQVGQYAGKMDVALKGFNDSDCPELVVHWNMQTIPSMRPLLAYIGDDQKIKFVSQVMEDFETKVLERSSDLQTGFIHGDFNDYNILVGPEDSQEETPATSSTPLRVSGILDFGDATRSLLIIEVAIAMTYMAVQCPPGLDPDELAGHVLAGYLSEMPLSREELELLPLTVCARLSQSLINGFHRLVLDPENPYCLVHADKAWPHLHRLWERPAAASLALWKTVADARGVKFPWTG